MSKTSLLLAGAAGLLLGAGGATLFARPNKADVPRPTETPRVDERETDDDELMAANANLVRSLSECNRRLTELGEKRADAPAPPAAASAADGGRRGRRASEPAAVDWERHAREGTVPYRIPCLRDTPWAPSQSQIDRLGLAPQDVDALRDAYKASNGRVMAELVPLCAHVVGTKETAERIGPQACMSAVMDSARRGDPEKAKEALSRVAETNGGKRAQPPPADALPIETLMMSLTKEQTRFEADLAAKLGPEEAKRLANARGLCSERGVARADGRN
jgi:hypothetical protein